MELKSAEPVHVDVVCCCFLFLKEKSDRVNFQYTFMSWELAKAAAPLVVPSGIVGGVVGGVIGGAVGGITGVATDNKEFGKQVPHISPYWSF